MLLELLVCCCVCAACAAIIIARTNRPIDWKRFDSLSALKAFRTRLEQISIVCERNFPRNTKGGLTTRLLLKNIRVFVVVVLFRRCCVVVAESCSSCFRCRDHLWGNVESEISSKEKSVVFSVALFLSLSHKRWRRLTRRTKKREREGFTERALTSPPPSCFCRRVFLLPRGVVYWCIRFVSRGGCAQSTLERGEEDSFPLHKGRRRRGGCDFWYYSSSERQF